MYDDMLSPLSPNRPKRGRGRLGLVTLTAVLVSAASLLTVPACSPSEEDIKEEIQAARACVITEECIDVGSTCPFGCSIVVNKQDADRIRDLVEGYSSNCQYDCVATQGVTCKAGRCEPLVGKPY
jgi:hypothetical protein